LARYLPLDQAGYPRSDLFLRTLQPDFASSGARWKGMILGLPVIPWRAAIMLYRLVTSIVAAVLSGMLTAAHAEESVTLRLKWFHQAQFAGFYVAKEKDFYKSAGLNVDIQPGGPDFPAIQMVTGGNEQFGVTGADQILIARSKGVPVVALAVIFRRNPFVLFSLAKSGIKAPADYAGKNIGVKIGGNEELIYRAVLAKAGVDKTKLNEIPVKFDITPLLAGTVDVWPGYLINEVLAAREKGFEVNVVSPADYGIDLYADTLFTTERMLKEKPDVVRKFVSATLKGWTSAIAAPEEAAQITVKYGSKLTFDHELAMMKASLPLLQPDAQPVGWMEAANWSAMQKLLVDAGFQKTPVDIGKAFTVDFLK
jgi:NitT/TauT family transport system substrate-binding protein